MELSFTNLNFSLFQPLSKFFPDFDSTFFFMNLKNTSPTIFLLFFPSLPKLFRYLSINLHLAFLHIPNLLPEFRVISARNQFTLVSRLFFFVFYLFFNTKNQFNSRQIFRDKRQGRSFFPSSTPISFE